MAQYATKADLEAFGLPSDALASPVTDAIIDAHLLRASEQLDSYARSRYSLPLSSPYAGEVVATVVALAAHSLLVWRGFAPDEFDESFRERQQDAVRWMRDLSSGRVNLDVAADATPNTREGRPRVYSVDSRGW